MSLGSLKRRLVSMCCRGRSGLYVEFSCGDWSCILCVDVCVWNVLCCFLWLCWSSSLPGLGGMDSRLVNVALCRCRGAGGRLWVCRVYKRCLNVFCLWNDGYCPWAVFPGHVSMDAPRCGVQDVFPVSVAPLCPMFDEVWVCCSRRRQWCVFGSMCLLCELR